MAGFLSLITKQDTQRFLREHEHDDERQLVLKHREINGIPSSMIAAQLSGRRKAKTKLPTWYNTDGIFYPPTVNIEQSSSEATAIYKTSIIKESISSHGLAVDLTGGFGVDSYFLSKAFDSVHYVEPNVELMEITKHNHQQVGATNIIHHCTTAEHFIDQAHIKFNLVFIDPSRRDEQSRRVHKLADCTPDITQLQSALFAISNSILLKASPLLDIQQGLLEIKHVKKVIVVSVGNECKELLFLAEKDYDQEPVIEAVTLFENGSIRSSVSFTLADERMAKVLLGEPGLYLYEPNASVLKAGAFKWIGEKFGLTKLGANTHLYNSTKALPDFPGKVFFIECLNPDAKQLKEFLPMGLANVVSRNYPLTTDEIKKKYHLRDGGSLYLIGFTSAKKKFLALCSRVTYT